MPDSQPLRVFVSSTSEDLGAYRAVAQLAIADLGWAPIMMMEHGGPDTERTVKACLDQIDEADLVLLIMAFRQGWVPSTDQGGDGADSITALELAHARGRKKDVLAFLASENWPGGRWDREPEKYDWVRRFRESIRGYQPVGFFDPEEQVADEARRFPVFRGQVRSALQSHAIKLAKARSAVAAGGIDFTKSARLALESGRVVPLLGAGIHGSGPLSAQALIASFGDPAAREPSFVAAAECFEDYLPDRAAFLAAFQAALEEQSRSVPPPLVHDLLLRLKPPPLVVSASSDLVLERRLEAEGKPLVLVTHVIRSFDGAATGRVAVIRSLSDRSKVELCAPDAISDRLRGEGGGRPWIVYKPLGSPLLHALFDEELGIDTVVATETDYLALLALLRTRSTGVPTAFGRPIQQNPFVFLGYPLDAWNYRLLLHVLQSVGAVEGDFARAVPLRRSLGVAVRVPSSPLEEIAWQRLRIDVVKQDVGSFARSMAPPA